METAGRRRGRQNRMSLIKKEAHRMPQVKKAGVECESLGKDENFSTSTMTPNMSQVHLGTFKLFWSGRVMRVHASNGDSGESYRSWECVRTRV